MNSFQREVLQQIKAGIDRARHEGVLVEYPRGALIDSEWVPWPFDSSAPETSPAPKQLETQLHGHVTPRSDGVKARCGGPAICGTCARELAALNTPVTRLWKKRSDGDPACANCGRTWDMHIVGGHCPTANRESAL